MPSLNFAEIKANVSAEQCLAMLGITAKAERGNQLRAPCPCGHGDDRALSVNTDKRTFYCHGAKTGGSLIDLVAHVYACDIREAAELLFKEFGPFTRAQQRQQLPASSPPPRQEQPGRSKLEPKTNLVAEHQDVQRLGLSPATASDLGIGFNPNGWQRGSVLVPVRLPTGDLLGYFAVPPGSDVTFHDSIESNVIQLRRKA